VLLPLRIPGAKSLVNKQTTSAVVATIQKRAALMRGLNFAWSRQLV